MMNETATPDISVIVPVYDAEAYLRRCLDSLLAQDFTQWEAICVDDGSRDGSGALLDEYAAADSRFVVIHQENAGVAAARNKALDAARGKYLVFLDADDWYAPEAMGMYCRALQGSKADIACSAFYQYGNRRAPLLTGPYKYMPVGIVSLEQRNLKFVVCCGWAKAYRRDIVEANDLRFDKGMKLGEDVLFVFRYLAHCRYMALEPAPLYNYLTNEDSAVQQGAGGRYPVEVYDMNMLVPVLASDYMRKVVPEWARRREHGYFFSCGSPALPRRRVPAAPHPQRSVPFLDAQGAAPLPVRMRPRRGQPLHEEHAVPAHFPFRLLTLPPRHDEYLPNLHCKEV